MQQPPAFLKPGISPGFDHSVRFVLAETLSNEHSFQVCAQIIDCARKFRRIENRILPHRATDAIAGFLLTPLEKNGIGGISSLLRFSTSNLPAVVSFAEMGTEKVDTPR